MTVYVESSAVLTWLLGQNGADRVRQQMEGAETIVTSTVTIAEVTRAILRADREGLIKAGHRHRLRGIFNRALSSWFTMQANVAVIERAGEEFPVEPVRTLDALHLSSILHLLEIYPDLVVLSLDQRICQNLEPLGIAQA